MTFIRIAPLALLAGLLGGCGFHPLYGTGTASGSARQVFSSIYVDTIDAKDVGYELRNDLIDGLHGASKPTEAAYRLKISASQYLQGIAVENNAAVTRFNYTLDITYNLSDMRTDKVLKSGSDEALASFDVVTSPYATLVAQQGAQKRSAEDIAYRIRIELSAYFAKHPVQPEK